MRELFGEEYLHQLHKRDEEAEESLAQYFRDLIEKDELADVTKSEYLVGCKVNLTGLYDCEKCEKKDIEGKDMFALKCSHKYCFNCYREYVFDKIKEKASYDNVYIYILFVI